MYQNHVPMINAAMRANPQTFKRGVMFAILSARMPFTSVPDQLKDVAKHGAKSRFLFAWKHDAFAYVEDNYRTLWRDVTACDNTGSAIAQLCTIPGMGIVKSAFVLQFLGHDIACLDTRNIARLNRNPRAYETRGGRRKTGPAFARLIARYVQDMGGHGKELWDTWCEDVATVYNRSPMEISALHCAIVTPIFRKRWQARDQIPF